MNHINSGRRRKRTPLIFVIDSFGKSYTWLQTFAPPQSFTTAKCGSEIEEPLWREKEEKKQLFTSFVCFFFYPEGVKKEKKK